MFPNLLNAWGNITPLSLHSASQYLQFNNADFSANAIGRELIGDKFNVDLFDSLEQGSYDASGQKTIRPDRVRTKIIKISDYGLNKGDILTAINKTPPNNLVYAILSGDSPTSLPNNDFWYVEKSIGIKGDYIAIIFGLGGGGSTTKLDDVKELFLDGIFKFV